MTRNSPIGARSMQVPALIGGAVLFVLALPVILPFVGVLHWRDKRRLRAAARVLQCHKCGHVLGERAIEAANEAWAMRLKRTQRKLPASIRFRMVRNLDAICTNCGSRYEFLPKTREFAALLRLSGRGHLR